MPRRLLREPHVLAHELRTPLSLLAGWYSMIRDGDINPETTPDQWDRAMVACREAVDRLNLIIAQACDEAIVLNQRYGPDLSEVAALMEKTEQAIQHSRETVSRLEKRRQRHRNLVSATLHD